MALDSGRVKKVSGYAQRVFFNDNIEYRDFSDDLVGIQLTSEGGTPLFTMGNFSVTTNIEPTPSKTFNRGTFSQYYCLDNLSTEDDTFLTIEGNLKTQLNLDITNPLHYVWYGNFSEYLRVSLNDIFTNWPAAIYVDNFIGTVSGDNVTNYSYDPISDTSTFTAPTKYFVNPYGIKYTSDAQYTNDSDELNNLRNLTVNNTSYVIDIDGTEFKIKGFTASTIVTNDNLVFNVEGESFPSLTATSTSTPYFIKPNEQNRETFFSGLNDFQRNLLNRLTNPIYTMDIFFPQEKDTGTIVYTNRKITFPVLDDGYNLNFFDGLYNSYLEDLVSIIENFDDNQTNLMVRKYTAEIINSFDSAPRCDADDLTNNGQKATNLLNIYGREFDEIKKYANGIKYAHVVTYDKKDNVPDSLVKDLAYMLGFEKIDFLSDFDLTKNLLPSSGIGGFSGQSRNMTLKEIDIELHRRLILNIAWLWKSKGARKSIEFLFKFIGAPESIVEFDEHVYVADKPLDVEQVKRMLFLYTGEADISKLPFDENGYPLPPVNGDLIRRQILVGTGDTQTVSSEVVDMYFQKAGGWYRTTGGANAEVDINEGNNPHVGRYDGGTEYIDYFDKNCFIPEYTPTSTVFTAHTRIYENLFINYNYGFINGMPESFEVYGSPLTLNNQLLNECVGLTASIDNSCPALSGGTGPSTLLEELCIQAREEYDEWVEKIKEEPYLRYSPEWEIVKRNNEIASKNYFEGVNKAACNDNACIEICVDVLDEVDGNPCDEWILVDDDNSTPFIYFVDSDGNKVIFEEFPLCCVANGGTYKNFVFENGQEACYCSRSAPCNGLIPSATRNDNVVVWEQTDGDSSVSSNPTAEVGGHCYYVTDSGKDAGITVERIIKSSLQGLLDAGYIAETQCHSSDSVVTTVESTVECCVWYGYEFAIQTDGKIYCIDNSNLQSNTETHTNTSEVTASLASMEETWKQSEALVGEEAPTTEDAKIAYETNEALLSEQQTSHAASTEQVSYETDTIMAVYSTDGNLDVTTSEYSIIEEQYSRLNIAVYLKATPTSVASTDFKSTRLDPDLSDCSVWEPKIDQENGLVFFSALNEEGAYIGLSPAEELYKNCCLSSGFDMGCFRYDDLGNIFEVSCEDKSSYEKIIRCYDPTFVKCGDVTGVKMVLPANEWQGFLLPKEVDGKCELNITADIMIKYEAESLINCASVNRCGFHLSLYDNSLYDLGCMNWVTFNGFDSVIGTLKNNTQLADWNSVIDWVSINPDYVFLKDVNTSQYVTYFDQNNIQVWQTPGLQEEPNQQCCEALGGEIVNKKEWKTVHQTNVTEIETEFGVLLNSIEDGVAYSDKVLEELTRDFLILEQELYDYTATITCIELPLFQLKERPGKGFDYGNVVTTQNVCNLPIPLECGLYTHLLEYYWTRLNIIILVKDAIEDCILKKESILKELQTLLYDQRIKSAELTKFSNECDTTISGYESQLLECNNNVTNIENEIDTLLHDGSDDPYIQQQINELNIQLDEERTRCITIEQKLNAAKDDCDATINSLNNELTNIQTNIDLLNNNLAQYNCCTQEVIENLETINSKFGGKRNEVILKAQECYDRYNTINEENFNKFVGDESNQALDFIDELEVCLTLEVDNNLGTQIADFNRRYTTLDAYTTKVWEFDPYQDYTGIIIEGEKANVDNVKESIFIKMQERYGASSVTENTFEPNWQRVTLPITDEQLRQLKTLYPDKPFFIGFAIKNYECDVCVLVDNIQISVETDEIERKFSFENCPSFNLNCIIDDRKSWVFSDGSVTEVYDVPGINSCNVDPLADNNKRIVKFQQPQERSWLDLEYRYTDYKVNHELLVINSKEASFRIDAAKAIECDVYNFWQQIECDGCAVETISGCSESENLLTNGEFTGGLTDWIVDPALNWVGSGDQAVYNGADEGGFLYQYVTETGVTYDISFDLNFEVASDDGCLYEGVYVNVGGDNLYGPIYPASGDTITPDGTLSGLSNTINLTLESIRTGTTLNGPSGASVAITGNTFAIYAVTDLGSCDITGLTIDNVCVSPTGSTSDIVTEKPDCLITGYTNVCTGETNEVTQQYIEINPLDKLDKDPSDVNIKAEMDKMVISNLIDVKSRQTISGYPLLWAFYELYLNASNCGEEFSGKYDYNNLFEFTDLIGDYWLDLLEQVIPATTIMDGCQNSGKVYRNNIFDQPKFKYKKYSLQYFSENIEGMVYSDPYSPEYGDPANVINCAIDEITDQSIGEQELCIEVLEKTVLGEPKSKYEACLNEIEFLKSVFEAVQSGLSATFGGDGSDVTYSPEFLALLEAKQQECNDIKNAEEVLNGFSPLTERNKVFITQIYDTNEYEGDVTVIGDPEWNKQDELIRVCGEH